MRLEMHWRHEDAASLPVAVWRAGPGWRMIASGVVGGGLGERQWVLNAQVPGGYDRMDPAAHIAELAAGLGLAGAGVGLLTAASVTDVVEREDEGVRVAATVGLRVPTWAAAPAGSADREFGPIRRPGAGTVDREVTADPAARHGDDRSSRWRRSGGPARSTSSSRFRSRLATRPT